MVGAPAPSIGGRFGKDNEPANLKTSREASPEMPHRMRHGAFPPIAGWDTRSPTVMPSLRAAPAITSST